MPTVFQIHGTAFMSGSLEANGKEGHGTLTELHEGKDKREFPFRVQSKVREEEKAKKTKHKLIKSLEKNKLLNSCWSGQHLLPAKGRMFRKQVD